MRLAGEEGHADRWAAGREISALDNQTYREINKVDTLTTSQALRRLRDYGLFEQEDRGSATWYRPMSLMLGGDGEVLSGNAQFSNPGPLSSNQPFLSRSLSDFPVVTG